MLSAKISAKGQVTLPKRVRQALDVKPGQRILFVVDDKKVLLEAIGLVSAKALAGSLGPHAGSRKPGSARGAAKREVARAAAEEG